jgi:hypothetical protein
MESLSETEREEVATYEDLRSCANRMVWTIELQIERLRESVSQGDSSDRFVLRSVSEAEFLIVALDRLLAIARKIGRMAPSVLDEATSEYQRALPNLRTARNVIAHLDEYLSGGGRDTAVRPGALSLHRFDHDRVDFGGSEFGLGTALLAAQKLFATIRQCARPSYQKALLLQLGAPSELQRLEAADQLREHAERRP